MQKDFSNCIQKREVKTCFFKLKKFYSQEKKERNFLSINKLFTQIFR